MEETQIDGGEELGDDFYEKIEAPKFVDLTAPDRLRPQNDDRYWFCLRVGCDQKHEEEMDSEEIYKKFVLGVMAARSPNIRFRKTLCRKDPSGNLKCPLTVPAKSSKSRISRMAMVSSIVDGKVKARPLPKQSLTPKVKPSSVAAKSLTTPRNKKRLSNPQTFRSVRNPKPTSVAVPKNRVVAKALVFHSPKKTELSSRVKAICAGMKKLEITDGKKPPLDGSKKQFRGREVKSRVYDSLRSKSCHGKEDKSSKKLSKKTNKEKDAQQACGGPAPTEGVENDSSDMEIEEKSRNGLLEVCSTSGSENEAKVMDGDDKENESKAMSDNDTENDFRNLNLVDTSSQIEKKKIHETCSKSNQTVSKGGLNRKPKITNPKPFRLRTDERQILKEKKLHHLDEPLKEITATARIPGGSSQRKLNKAVHRNETCLEQVEHVSERESDKTEQKGEHGPPRMRTACSQASKGGAVGRKRSTTTTTTQQRCTISMHQKPNIAAASQQEMRTKSTKKKTISLMSQPCRLSVIKESSPTTIVSATKVVLKPVDNGASPSSKTSISAETRRRRRRMTVPKEPQIHGVHMPKSCTRRAT